MTRSRADLLALLFLPLLALVPYLPALRGEFVIDDVRFVQANGENLAHAARPWVYFADPSTNADVPDGDIYRPLRTWSYALDRNLSTEPFVFHLHNVLLHALATLLLWRLLRPRREGGEDAAQRLLACALFAVHPLASEAVAWISGRSDPQAAVLVLAALLVARAAEARRGLLLATAGLGFLCGFAKETAVVVPALALVEGRWRRGTFSGGFLPVLALAVGAAAYLAVYLSVTDRGLAGQVSFYEGSFASHLPYALAGLGTHLRLFVWPSGLNPLWETNLFQPLGALRPVGAAVLLAALCGVAVAARRRHPAVTAGLAWWAVALLPASNVLLPLRTVLAERFAYLPLMGLCLASSALLFAVVRSRRAAAVVAALLVVALAGRTAVRAGDWSSAERLYEATLASFPTSFAANYGLGGERLREGEAAAAAGRTADAASSLDEAALRFAAAARAAEGDPGRQVDARFGQGRALLVRGRFEEAAEVLLEVDRTLDRHPELARTSRHAAEARFQLGLALSRIPRLAEAEEVFRRLIEVHGETARRRDAYGEVLRARLDGRAIEQYDRALVLDPNHHPARIHLAEVLHLHEAYATAARQQLREVLARDPSNRRARELLEAWEREDAP